MADVGKPRASPASQLDTKRLQPETSQKYTGVCPTTSIIVPDQHNSHIVEAKQVYLLSRKTHVTTRVFRPHDKSFFSDTVGLNFSSSRRQKMVHIHAGGHDLICSRKHLILARDSKTGKISWTPAERLSMNHQVATPGLAPTTPPTYPNTPLTQSVYSPLLNKFRRFVVSTRDVHEQRRCHEYDPLTAYSFQAHLRRAELIPLDMASRNLNRFLSNVFSIDASYEGPQGLPVGLGIPTPIQALRRAYLLRLYKEGIFPMHDTSVTKTFFRLAGALVGRVEYSVDLPALKAWTSTYFVDFLGFDEEAGAEEHETPSSSSSTGARDAVDESRPTPTAAGGRTGSELFHATAKDVSHPLLRCLPPMVHTAPLPAGRLFIDDAEIAAEISRDIDGLGFGLAKQRRVAATSGTLFVVKLPPLLVLSQIVLGFFSKYFIHHQKGAPLHFSTSGPLTSRTLSVTVRAPRLVPSGVVSIPPYALHRAPLAALAAFAAGLISSRGVRQLDPRKSLQHGLLLTPLIIAGGREVLKTPPPDVLPPRGARLRAQLDYLFSKIGLPVSFSEKIARNFICPIDVAWDHRFAGAARARTPSSPAARAAPERASFKPIALAPIRNTDIVQVHFFNALSAYWAATRVGFPYHPSLRRATPWIITQTRYPFFLLGNFGKMYGKDVYSHLRESFKLGTAGNRGTAPDPNSHRAVSTSFAYFLQTPKLCAALEKSVNQGQNVNIQLLPPVPSLLALIYARFVNGVPFPYEMDARPRKKPKWAPCAPARIEECFGRNIKASFESNSKKEPLESLLSLSKIEPVAPSLQKRAAFSEASPDPAGVAGAALSIDDVTFSLISSKPGPIVSVPTSMYPRPSPIVTWTPVDWALDVGKRTACSFKLRPRYANEYGIVLGGILTRSAALK
eukprot:gnl/Chilomastix_cuspidata/1947.p1 GENE.gnl/Chilomastix_cuspidata/1947~~gnl/Chilomastix_cuspidata/1947.p1  ORF type:complete len:903 (+),score=210.01 gnl/Chilomastix_cuspidata/1947:652-3360(+)